MIGISILSRALLFVIHCQAAPTIRSLSTGGTPIGPLKIGNGPIANGPPLPKAGETLPAPGPTHAPVPKINLCTVARTQDEWNSLDLGHFLLQEAVDLQPFQNGVQQAIIDLNPNISDLGYTCGL